MLPTFIESPISNSLFMGNMFHTFRFTLKIIYNNTSIHFLSFWLSTTTLKYLIIYFYLILVVIKKKKLQIILVLNLLIYDAHHKIHNHLLCNTFFFGYESTCTMTFFFGYESMCTITFFLNIDNYLIMQFRYILFYFSV